MPMKATCEKCGTEIEYEEAVNPFRCYNCGSEIPKEEIVETDDEVGEDDNQPDGEITKEEADRNTIANGLADKLEAPKE